MTRNVSDFTGLRPLGPTCRLPNFSVGSFSWTLFNFLNVQGNAVINGEIRQISDSDYSKKWLIFFFYPLDFTFVCPTEIIAFSDRSKEFRDLGAEVIACSCDSHFSHLAWTQTPRKQGGLGNIQIPLLADFNKKIATEFGVLDNQSGLSYRWVACSFNYFNDYLFSGLFLIDPTGIIRHTVVNDLPVGRSVDETLRVLKAFQFVEKHGEVCPADWEEDKPTINTKNPSEYFDKVNKK